MYVKPLQKTFATFHGIKSFAQFGIFRQIDGILHTVWKFQNLSVIQILREINFGYYKGAKSAVFCHFRGCEVCSFGKFQPSKSAKMLKSQNS